MSEHKCPKCGSENIQKCEIAYMQGTANLSAMTTIGNREAKTSGQTTTTFAQIVAPPAEKEVHWGVFTVFLFITALT